MCIRDRQLTARQAELAAAKPALDAARAEAGRHAGDAAQLDALTAQVTQAQSAPAAYDALDTLCRQQTEARDAARLAAAPVSYTHLDVYKRQALMAVFLSLGCTRLPGRRRLSPALRRSITRSYRVMVCMVMSSA